MGFSISNLMLYNTEIKIAGDIVTLKTYEKQQSYAYKVERAETGTSKLEMIVKEFKILTKYTYTNLEYARLKLKQRAMAYNSYYAKKERFIKSCYRAKKQIFDLISCNVGKHLDYIGQVQRVKFLTLTFKENMGDIEKANYEITKFMKRLSYSIFKVKKNVLKYISVPELQERGAWHFHIVLFNCPYIHFRQVLEIWDNGGVYIQALPQGAKPTVIARYITKYISKGIEIKEDISENSIDTLSYNDGVENLGDKRLSNFDNYLRLNLVNKKRYQASKGLIKPTISKLKIDRKEWAFFIQYMTEKAEKMKKKNKDTNEIEEVSSVFLSTYDNEYRGQVNILVAELSEEHKRAIISMAKIKYKDNRKEQSKEISPNWGYVKNILFNQLINRKEYKETKQDKEQRKKEKNNYLVKRSIINYPAYTRGY